MILNEGLTENDLEGLISNTISVDEYNSKIDDDAIVVGFSVDDKEPAHDLSNFIERRGLDILDSEVSPGPDENGKYWVFVEFERNHFFSKILLQLLSNVSNISGFDNWMMTVYHKNGSKPVSEKNIQTYVRLDAKMNEAVSAQILEYFQDSFVDNIMLEDIFIRFDKSEYKIVAYSSHDKIYERFNFVNKSIRLDEGAFKKMNKLHSILGHNWYIDIIEDYIVCQKEGSEKTIVLKD